MKITKIKLYKADVPMRWGVSENYDPDTYVWKYSKGRQMPKTLPHAFAVVETDEGFTGVGEIDIYGSNYITAFMGAVAPGFDELAPALIGMDPIEIANIERKMDSTIYEHGYIKMPIDMACWDIIGKASGQPLVNVWGGKAQESVANVEWLPRDTAENMKKEVEYAQDNGFQMFQMKIGMAPLEEEIELIKAVNEGIRPGTIWSVDANAGLTVDKAARIERETQECSYLWEQPCATLEENRNLAHRYGRPIILDESIITVQDVVRAYNMDCVHAINLKVSRCGGMSKSRRLRDAAVSLGIPMNRIEDSWGSAVSSAATNALAQATPANMCYSCFDARINNGIQTAFGSPEQIDGHVTCSDKPGLGVELNMDIMKLVAEYQ